MANWWWMEVEGEEEEVFWRSWSEEPPQPPPAEERRRWPEEVVRVLRAEAAALATDLEAEPPADKVLELEKLSLRGRVLAAPYRR